MRKILIVIALFAAGTVCAQDLSKDVSKELKLAEHHRSKKEANEAIMAYKEVIRSYAHIESMEAIGDINMKERAIPKYTEACEYYQMALDELSKQIAAADKKSDKAKLGKDYQRIEPKRNKACSYVEDYEEMKEEKKAGSRLLEEEGLSD